MRKIESEAELDSLTMFEEVQIGLTSYLTRVPGGLVMRQEVYGDLWDHGNSALIETPTGVTSCFIPWAPLPSEEADEPVDLPVEQEPGSDG